MKKFVAILMALCLALTAVAACAATVQPHANLTTCNGGEEFYTVNFDYEKDLTDTTVTYTPRNLDEYKASEVENLKAGDVIVSFGEEVTVETVEKQDETILVNGGFFEGGVTLVMSEDDAGVYYSQGYDDILARTPGETVTMKLADQVIVVLYRLEEDGSYNGNTTSATMPAAEVKAYLTEHDDFDGYTGTSVGNTFTVFLENDAVTEIHVDWAPNV